jgi:hypothetical protein
MRLASFRLNVRVFSAFLIVGLVMLIAAGYFVVGIGQAGLRDSWGEHLQQVADQAAAAVDTYVFRLVIDASVLSHVPGVGELAASASERPFDRQAAAAIDREWQQAGPPAAVKDLSTNKVSAFLAEVTRQNPIYRELLLTDRHGRVVATSGHAVGYLYADAAWWKEAFGDGTHGQLVVSDVRFDPRARVFGMEITAPVTAAADGPVVGVLRTVVDVRELGAVLGGVRMGATGDAALLREDGSFVFTQTGVDPNGRFFATDLLRERLAAAKQGEPQTPLHFGARTTNGSARLVGVAISQLRASFPRASWLVAVSQGEDELFATVRTQATSLALLLGLTAIAVLLFALWYSMRLAAPSEPEEMDMHLTTHPRVHRIEEPEEVEERAAERV